MALMGTEPIAIPPIVVENLSKRYRRFQANRPTTLVETIARGFKGLRTTDYFWALQDVSFAVSRGQMLGVIGHNGAGKSTLLRLLGSVGQVDKGAVRVNGRIGALLDLGTGFHPELTGRENVFIAGIIGGLTRREVARRFDEIIAFAELEAFVDSPLRTYSTGMQMRLAFAVAVHIEPEILLIDEVLAVGDIAFQQKCLARIARFKENGCTIVLVSHDVGTVQALCDQVLWLRQGQVASLGPTDLVAEQYVAEMSAETKRRTPQALPPMPAGAGEMLRVNENRFGSQEMQITAVHLKDASQSIVAELSAGQPLTVEIQFQAPQPIEQPIVGVTIAREDGTVVYDTSTEAAEVVLPVVSSAGRICLHLARLDLLPGRYFVDVGIYQAQWEYAYDYHWHIYPLAIIGGQGQKGFLSPPHTWELAVDL
jgi:lipopolysaccharide transport system ATP-binding protein